MDLTFEQTMLAIQSLGTIFTLLAIAIAWFEYRAKKPALAAQTEEANTSVLATSLSELRMQIQEGNTRSAKLEEELSKSRRDGYLKDIQQDKDAREQAAKIEELAKANDDLKKQLDSERTARKRDVEDLQKQVTRLQEENRELRQKNIELTDENTKLKATKPTRTRKKVSAQMEEKAAA